MRLLGDGTFYSRGCTDGAALVLSLALLCATVSLIMVNYLDVWPVYLPSMLLLVVIMNMASFSSSSTVRFTNRSAIYTFLLAHSLTVVACVIFLALLVTQTPLFLSSDCEACSTQWATRDDQVCARAMSECRGLGKYRFAIFVLFPLSAGCFAVELVNLASAAMSTILLKR